MPRLCRAVLGDMSSINTMEKPQIWKPFWLNNYIPYLPPLVIVFLSILVYSNTLWHGFAFDDVRHIVQNEFIRKSQYLPSYVTSDFWKMANYSEKPPYYRPIFLLSLFADYKLWGLNPFGFHLTNILIHISTIMLLYTLALNLFQDKFIALISSLIFGLHPVHTEAVTFISARTHLLATLFSLLSVWGFINRRGSKGWFYISLLSFILALLSNEIAVILPLLIILVLYCFYREPFQGNGSFIRRIVKG